jgi:hypothetical protein
LAAVVVPVLELRAEGKTHSASGWLGCEFDAPEARRLGLVDQVVSNDQLEELIGAAKGGALGTEWVESARVRDDTGVGRALGALEDIARMV